jgi:hypothetical protein
MQCHSLEVIKMGRTLDEGLYCIDKLFNPGSSLSRVDVDTNVPLAKKEEPYNMKKIRETVKEQETLDPRPSWEIERDVKVGERRNSAQSVCPY